jgi:hypothetical protein
MSLPISRMATEAMSTLLRKPHARNRVACSGFVVMSGVPDRQYLPEHEHPELQLTARFGSTAAATLIRPFEPHPVVADRSLRA